LQPLPAGLLAMHARAGCAACLACTREPPAADALDVSVLQHARWVCTAGCGCWCCCAGVIQH
jgi:hypothetical protein